MNPGKSKVAIYCNGDFSIGNSQIFSGQVYSQSDLSIHDGNVIYGSVAAKGEIREIHDKNDFYYTLPLESLTSQFFGGGSGSSEGRPAQIVHWLE